MAVIIIRLCGTFVRELHDELTGFSARHRGMDITDLCTIADETPTPAARPLLDTRTAQQDRPDPITAIHDGQSGGDGAKTR